MKSVRANRTRVFTLLIVLLFAVQAAWAGTLSVVPRPKTLQPRDGVFRLSPRTTIIVDENAAELGEYLKNLLSPATGFPLPVERADDQQAAKPGSIRLRLTPDTKELGEEGYTLSVGNDRVAISAPTEAGLFYGIQTLRQLFPSTIEGQKPAGEKVAWEIPCVQIEDTPRFVWRGLMMDCSRTFWSKDYLKRLIEWMALYKLNRLHLHLTDDQGWRLEIKKHPRLTEVGSKFAKKDHQRPEWEGYYTQADMEEIIEFAKQNHVTIVPEIEMPGHSLALLRCYPELSCAGGSFEIRPYGRIRGIQKDICCAGNEKTFQFFEDVLSEVVELFPCEYIHVGGDEAPKNRWKACPKCQARIKAEGLKDERELQSYFMKRIEKFLNTKGKRLIGWDEILEGGLAPNATVMSWRGTKGGIAAAKAGHDVVMTPKQLCYLNYRRASAMRLYGFDPVPKELNPDEAKHILGAQACFWAHTFRTPAGANHELFPRLLSIAEMTWTPQELRNADSFRSRALEQVDRLGKLGVKCGPEKSLSGKGSPPSKREPDKK